LGRRAGAVTLSQPAVVLRRNPLLLASSVDPREQRKSDACLRMVRLTEHAPQRPVSEGSYRQVRNDRRPVSGEPANARLTRRRNPSRSQNLAASLRCPHGVDHHPPTWLKPLAPIALHGSPCRAVGQCRDDGAMGRTFRGARESPLRNHRKRRARRMPTLREQGRHIGPLSLAFRSRHRSAGSAR
jgi:hypothetical protein